MNDWAEQGNSENMPARLLDDGTGVPDKLICLLP